MKIIKKEKLQRGTGLVKRIREIAAQGGRLTLTTAADVIGYVRLASVFKGMGIDTRIRRDGTTISVYVNLPITPVSARKCNPRLRKALIGLKKGTDCLVLTTPLEAHQFNTIRGDLNTREGIAFRAMRNCTDVWVWKETP